MVRSRINLRLLTACLLSAAVAGCQTTKANLNAGLGGAPTPIIVASRVPDDFFGGRRVGQTNYFYLNSGSDADKAARLGVGLAFGAVGALANAAIVQSNTEQGVVALHAPLSQSAYQFSMAPVAAAVPNARVEAVGPDLPKGAIVLFPGVILEESGGQLKASAHLRGVQVDADGVRGNLLPLGSPVSVPLTRADVIAGRAPAGFVDATQNELARLARQMISGAASTATEASGSPAPRSQPERGNGKSENTAVIANASAPAEAAAAPVPVRPAYRCNHTRVCQPTG